MKKLIALAAVLALVLVAGSAFAAPSDQASITINIEVEKWVEIDPNVATFTMTVDSSGQANNSAHDQVNFQPSATVDISANCPFTLEASGSSSFTRSTDSAQFWKAMDGSNVIGYYIALKPNMNLANSNDVKYGPGGNPLTYVVDPAVDGPTQTVGIGGALGANDTPDGSFAVPGSYSDTITLTATVN